MCDECGDPIPDNAIFIRVGALAVSRYLMPAKGANPLTESAKDIVTFPEGKDFCCTDCFSSALHGSAKHADVLLPKKKPMKVKI
jgi:hypothetical protein